MKLLRLGNTGKSALVDDDIFDRARRYAWTVAAEDNVPRRQYAKAGRYHTQRLSHFILGVVFGNKVRYLDGNPLNCQRSNLQLMSGAVVLNKRSKRAPFRVKLSIYNRQIMLGSYPTKAMAQSIRDLAQKKKLELIAAGVREWKVIKAELRKAAGLTDISSEEMKVIRRQLRETRKSLGMAVG